MNKGTIQTPNRRSLVVAYRRWIRPLGAILIPVVSAVYFAAIVENLTSSGAQTLVFTRRLCIENDEAPMSSWCIVVSKEISLR